MLLPELDAAVNVPRHHQAAAGGARHGPGAPADEGRGKREAGWALLPCPAQRIDARGGDGVVDLDRCHGAVGGGGYKWKGEKEGEGEGKKRLRPQFQGRRSYGK